jgi:hypothetical protein
MIKSYSYLPSKRTFYMILKKNFFFFKILSIYIVVLSAAYYRDNDIMETMTSQSQLIKSMWKKINAKKISINI